MTRCRWLSIQVIFCSRNTNMWLFCAELLNLTLKTNQTNKNHINFVPSSEFVLINSRYTKVSTLEYNFTLWLHFPFSNIQLISVLVLKLLFLSYSPSALRFYYFLNECTHFLFPKMQKSHKEQVVVHASVCLLLVSLHYFYFRFHCTEFSIFSYYYCEIFNNYVVVCSM